uniref:Kinesin motor domain-containing protein n=1 Tax=Eutreptiella gymnastica TaxID=73025 RepID=A0A6T2HID9_9EUGL|mmetsp:Transcript_101753/g.172341  ORF Transcript_101753/g.172341 Transcript_101753/m.172341 type:complete len:736 (-) Transcript_101753:733-2940(-)|eukprot:CAMPEP_0174318498 /NCGR_PEP_ID=MMETSP0810-20121108/8251_1 /TAXON_ID=73025 ORGANISM="Eutreptiella gymnastica-like, Strain CCMP1594" /NCGR_SAMPLE_ID=MMETSP0810 /ASSEMBLY_ACC=CAM_ASM_000659 /LENGTH=735 /DNA_ID=CAMNT_0015428753 /DNA_START=53 /DNA_END=2260 /DNA_ORIENTATION=+
MSQEVKRSLEAKITGALQTGFVDDDVAFEITNTAMEGRAYKEALEVFKDPIKKDKPQIQIRALTLMGCMIRVGENQLAAALATSKWRDRLLKVAKSKDETVRDVLCQQVADWHFRYQGQGQEYAEFTIMFNRLKSKGFRMPEHRGSSRATTRTSSTSAPPGTRFTMTTTPEENAKKVDELMENVQADLRSMQIGLQDLSQLNRNVVENCKRHQNKIMLVLSTDLEESYTFKLIALYDQLGEYFDILKAIESADPAAGGASSSGSASAAAAGAETAEDEDESAELEALRNTLEQRKSEREACEAQCVRLRAELNDVKVKKSMVNSGAEDTHKKEELLGMVRKTIRASRGILADAKQQAAQMRIHCASLKRDSFAYAHSWEKEMAHLQTICDKAAKAEAKGFETLKKLYLNEMQMRKKLYNKIQEFRGNTRIYCRLRPLSQAERAQGANGVECVDLPTATEVVVRATGKPKIFEVDGGFKSSAKTAQIFEYEDAGGVVPSAVDGYNVCIFAYGDTGTGKTHTMQGDGKGDPGVIQLAIQKLYQTKQQRLQTEKIEIQLSVLEIVNEQITDLFEPRRTGLSVSISEQQGCYIDGLTKVECASGDEALSRIQQAMQNRPKGEEHASRSALIVHFQIHAEDTQTRGHANGKLYIIELPGAERQDKGNMNLGNVMEKIIAKSKSDQVPFKQAKLTHLLQDCLTGSAKQLFYICISPSLAKAEQSNASLAWAFRVRGVILGS